MTSFKIQPAHPDHISELAKVFRASRDHAFPYLPRIHSPEEDLAYFRNKIFPENEVYVALEYKNNSVMGFIAFTKKWVNHLYLRPDAQRQGLGGQLLAKAKEGSSSLDLWTFQRNSTAQSFYRKHGFRVVETTDGAGNEEKEPDFLLRWEREIPSE